MKIIRYNAATLKNRLDRTMALLRHSRLYQVSLLAIALAGCGSLEFPGVYKLTIQQGNIVSQEMIDRLKPGMTRSQVQFVLGNPVLADSFNRDRWNYVYTIAIPGQDLIERELVIIFEDDRLLRFEGDYVPSESAEQPS